MSDAIYIYNVFIDNVFLDNVFIDNVFIDDVFIDNYVKITVISNPGHIVYGLGLISVCSGSLRCICYRCWYRSYAFC